MQDLTSATRVALLMGAEPLFGALFASVWLDERLGLWGWLGGLLIVVASLVSKLSSDKGANAAPL